MVEESLPDIVQMARRKSQSQSNNNNSSGGSGLTRHRYQPSRGSSASKEERALILEQLKTTFGLDDDQEKSQALLKHLVNRMEFRQIQAGKVICDKGQNTAPSLYVVLGGKVQHSENKKKDTTVVFGKELLEKAEFRKTGGGKVVSSLVTAPYRYVRHGICVTPVGCPSPGQV